jgi:PKD repeat protein
MLTTRIFKMRHSIFITLTSLFLASCLKDDPTPEPKFIADFQIDIGNKGTVTLTSTTDYAQSYGWNFGDLSNGQNSKTVSHTYKNNGTYEIEHTVQGTIPGKFPTLQDGESGTIIKTISITNTAPYLELSGSGQTIVVDPPEFKAERVNDRFVLNANLPGGGKLEISFPANVTAPVNFSASTSEPMTNRAIITFTDNNSTLVTTNVSGCGNTAGAVNITQVTASSMSGTFSGYLRNCLGYTSSIGPGAFQFYF